MILLLRPEPPFVEFCRAENDMVTVDRIKLDPGTINGIVKNPDDIEGIGHLLCHGGEIFDRTVEVLSEVSIERISKCVGLSPEKNELTLKLAQVFIRDFPEVPQLVFCDTAYFVELPAEASTYAVPYVLRREGVRKYGGYGLVHQWAWEKTQAVSGRKIDKLISIYLGDNPNITAIRGGNPVETTAGFTSAEGLPSFHGCGDVDPTIVFQLHSKGMSFEEIYDLLSNKSGFTGLAGRECRYADVVEESPPLEISKVKQVLLYDIIKYIGAFISLLGGIDALVFVAKDLEQSKRFIGEICDNLDFLGLSCENFMPDANTATEDIPDRDHVVEVLCLEQSQWVIMAEGIRKRLKKGM